MPARRRSAALLYAVAAGALVLDQVSKVWVERALVGRPPIRVIPGVLSFTYTTNSGGAFGFGRSAPWLFAGASVIVAAAIVVASFRSMHRATALGLGLILGGAFGNLADRAGGDTLFGGSVTDFIDFHVWPVFNLADTAIVLGAILLALGSFEPDETDERLGGRGADELGPAGDDAGS